MSLVLDAVSHRSPFFVAKKVDPLISGSCFDGNGPMKSGNCDGEGRSLVLFHGGGGSGLVAAGRKPGVSANAWFAGDF